MVQHTYVTLHATPTNKTKEGGAAGKKAGATTGPENAAGALCH